MVLPIRDRMSLALAVAPYQHPGDKIRAARVHVGYTETRFWQRVDWLLDQAAAEAAMPVEVGQLRRLRQRRRLARAG